MPDVTGQNSEALRKWERHNPRVFEEMLRSGLRFAYGATPDGTRCVSVHLKPPARTERQRRIANLLSNFKLWTLDDIACAIGLDANNRGVLGEIGRDCRALHAYSRQVARLVGSHRFRVYSFDDDLLDMTLPKIRAIYRLEASRRKPSRSSIRR